MRAAFYKCAAAKKKKTCDKKAVRKQWLEDLVVNETMKLVEDDASMNAIIAKVMELQNLESTDLPIYEKQLKETEVGITNMLNAIQMGILTSSTKVLMTFNYKEGTETVAFGEAVKAEKSSDMSARGAPNFGRQIVRFCVLFCYVTPKNRSLHGQCTVFARSAFRRNPLHRLELL